jgi:hypothetical protein
MTHVFSASDGLGGGAQSLVGAGALASGTQGVQAGVQPWLK